MPDPANGFNRRETKIFMFLTIGKLPTWIVVIVLLAGSWACPASLSAQVGNIDPAAFDEGIALLGERNFAATEKAVARLADSGDERAEAILTALLAGDLYVSKTHDSLVIGHDAGRNYAIQDALTGKDLEPVGKRKLKKIGINNNLRGIIKNALAGIRLSHPDPDVRLKAIHNMLPSLEPADSTFLKRLLAQETHPRVQSALKVALALIRLQAPEGSDAGTRLRALDQLAGNLQPAVRNTIIRLMAGEADETVRAKATRILQTIDSRIRLYAFLETIFFGLSWARSWCWPPSAWRSPSVSSG